MSRQESAFSEPLAAGEIAVSAYFINYWGPIVTLTNPIVWGGLSVVSCVLIGISSYFEI